MESPTWSTSRHDVIGAPGGLASEAVAVAEATGTAAVAAATGTSASTARGATAESVAALPDGYWQLRGHTQSASVASGRRTIAPRRDAEVRRRTGSSIRR